MPVFGKQIPVAKVGGISIDIDPSWIFIFLFLTWGISAGYLPAAVPEQETHLYWIFGVLASLSLFVSVTLHELGHSLVARAQGMEVNRIVLFIFGGASQLEEEPEKPGSEFLMAIVGPVVSFVLAALFWVIHGALYTPEEKSLTVAFFAYLSIVNLVLGIFNLLPGFPLDGGRVLRSILWSHWKDLKRATRVASEVGAGFGLVLMILGGFQILSGAGLGGFWYILIGFFLRNAAKSSFQQLTLKQLLENVSVRDIMTDDPVTVDPGITLEDLSQDYILRYHHPAFPVVGQGLLMGIVHLEAIRAVPREQWRSKSVSDVMTPLRDLTTVSPDDEAQGLLRTIVMSGGRVLVRKENRLEGILSRRDILDYIAVNSDLDLGPRGSAGR